MSKDVVRTGRPPSPLAERFWSKVAIKSADDCWIWLAHKDQLGYGNFQRGGRKGRMFKAHRVAYELTNGLIPDGMVICHSCDNPSCVNPSHLWLGTQSDNIRDALAKGRKIPPGEFKRRNRSATLKLTDAAVLDIRTRFANGETQVALAKIFGVSGASISNIVNGKTWRHVT